MNDHAPCDHVRAALSAAHDGEPLDAEGRARLPDEDAVAAHLAACGRCRRWREDLAVVTRRTRLAGHREPPRRLRSAALAAFEAIAEQADAPGATPHAAADAAPGAPAAPRGVTRWAGWARDPRRWRMVAALVAAVVVGAGAALALGDRPEAAPTPSEHLASAATHQALAVEEEARAARRPEFTLTDARGEPWDFAAETEGGPALVVIGYTHCPDLCPAHLAEASLAREHAGLEGAEVPIVFVTVDPDRDSPERLASYLEAFDRDVVGLTGTPAEIDAALAALGLPEEVRAGTGTPAGDLRHHPAGVLLVRTDGAVEPVASSTLDDTARELAARLDERSTDEH